MTAPNRKSFLVRLDPKVLEALQRWAADEFRSLNGQVEHIFHEALRKQGRLPKTHERSHPGD